MLQLLVTATLIWLLVLVVALAVSLILVAVNLHKAANALAAAEGALGQVVTNTAPLTGALTEIDAAVAVVGTSLAASEHAAARTGEVLAPTPQRIAS